MWCLYHVMTCGGAIAVHPSLVPFIWMLFLLGASVGCCNVQGETCEREKRFRVYREAPGFRPGPCVKPVL